MRCEDEEIKARHIYKIHWSITLKSVTDDSANLVCVAAFRWLKCQFPGHRLSELQDDKKVFTNPGPGAPLPLHSV